ncbi:MAG: poly-beta-1,6-N-acetyl-D-glucosamine N-deacetylase PgaB [Methylicorpusculum sp.]|uniref:poly-beta-1,6-N-acetyl-D-glucosamine N-deacetylase PgaB n=1 Tax=Methylicorpusculum sp. TaxID=2713644 RepID=UPI002724FFF6|nr:poly-beta-1,6-N-acetyl-D-glucosamine N-deacetylase PgaB [Methylicorpusculum sp.]MDO8941247.1 poly-beta-1,6-N-acetyl-D-glucosamine N-deacetylase PgaB [Methylicorpusculum sp.]MDP2201051.1 poly-beta-1,6-N-acetyl-D-glucosamine N-deacetylase PgaB [Methylicorpusculum sp.]
MKQVIFLLIMLISPCCIAASQSFMALSYHDVQEKRNDEPLTVSKAHLIEQFSWLKKNNFHPVSLQTLINAQRNKIPLPDNTVLLTFDDGHSSSYKIVFPLLKSFGFPAVISIVTSWIEAAPHESVQYGTDLRPRNDFLTWHQIKEMHDSGLIEIATHSHDLHKGINGNPQGSLQPAATTRMFDNSQQRYESDEVFARRITQDLEQSVKLIEQHLKLKPRIINWPYGSYSVETLQLAQRQGLTLSLTLDEGPNNLSDAFLIKRQMISNNLDINQFEAAIKFSSKPIPIRVAQIDMDYIHDPNPEQTLRNLNLLLDRVKATGINTVYLQAFSDPNGDGNADAMYFPNRHMPVRADLFNFVAWQLRKKTGVSVYAWMPVLSFVTAVPSDWWVHEMKNGQPVSSQNNYKRLSPFNHEARQWIGGIYEDLAKQAHFSGVLFHDDAFLTDYEDASPSALSYKQNIPANAITDAKIKTLTRFTGFLADKVRFFHPNLKTARNLYAKVVMNPESSEWFAQSLPNFLQNYDYTAVMAMPFMENAEQPLDWLRVLITKVSSQPQGLSKTVFELQSVDWRTQEKIPESELEEQITLLQRMHALNYGYYPDDFHKDHPPASMLKMLMPVKRL